MVFFSLEYNNYYIENYARRNIGVNISELNIPINNIKNFDYIVLFSPTGSHCRTAIPVINSLNKDLCINIIGITTLSQKENLIKLQNELNPNFSIMMVDKKVFTDITLKVQLLLKVK